MSRTNLTELTHRYLRKEGWVGGKADGQQGPITRDFLGVGDSVWIRNSRRLGGRADGGLEALIVQHTDKGDMSKRLRKIARSPQAHQWLNEGGRIAVIGWGRKGAEMVPHVVEVDGNALAKWG